MEDQDESIIEEFKVEAAEMFDTSETGFLNLEKGEDFHANYNAIFRAFHSLKGAAGMFGLTELQSHMHSLESLFESLKPKGVIEKAQIDYFLDGLDVAKKLLSGEQVSFKYFSTNDLNVETSTEPASIEKKKNNVISPEPPNGVIYIIDDEPDVVDILSEFIKMQGLEVKSFYSAIDALQNIDLDNPDAVLIDINMPQMSGLDFIMKCNDEKIDIPTILISGFLTQEIKAHGRECGAFAFIEKPFDNDKDLATCLSAVKQQKIMKLLNKSINYILYQFSDLDLFLKQQGKESIRLTLKNELASMLELKKNLKSVQSSGK